MNSITTSAKPGCDLCGFAGAPVRDGVPDPDGMIPGTWSFRQCCNPQCGVYWLDPAPVESELWKAYTSYHTHTRQRSGKLGKNVLSMVNRLLKLLLLPIWAANGMRRDMKQLRFMTLEHDQPGKVLDVGCGAGRFLRRMQKRGWNVEGVEFDPQAAQKVAARYGIRVHVGDLRSAALADESCDVVTMNQVMEHVFDPRATLSECLRVLKPGGKLVMTTPNVNSVGAGEFGPYWRGWEPPRHLHLFSVEALKRLTHQCGFEINEARSYSWDAAGVYRVSKSNGMKATGMVGFFDQLRLLGWGYYKELREHHQQKRMPNTAQNVLIVARKPSPARTEDDNSA